MRGKPWPKGRDDQVNEVVVPFPAEGGTACRKWGQDGGGGGDRRSSNQQGSGSSGLK